MHFNYESLLLGILYAFIVGKVGHRGRKNFLNIKEQILHLTITIVGMIGVILTSTKYACLQSHVMW